MRYSSFIGLFCVVLFLNSVANAQSPSGVVRIGILNDQFGPYADFGGKTSVDAARMAVEDVGGKVLGKPIEIIVGDHQNKPDVKFRVFFLSPVGTLGKSLGQEALRTSTLL